MGFATFSFVDTYWHALDHAVMAARRWWVVLFLTLTGGCGGTPAGPSDGSTPLVCGTERWSVKTLSDADASRVNFTPIATTIRDLNGHPSHCEGGPDRREFEEEFQVFEVTGKAIYINLEDDRDYHLALADSTDNSFTMITEIPDPACQGAMSSPYVSSLRDTRMAFSVLLGGRSPSSLVGQTVHVRGVGFYDFNHGQIGRARNCMELHPLIQVQRGP